MQAVRALGHASPSERADAVPALLWCAGVALLPATTQGDAWPLALGWAAAGLLLAAAWRRTRGGLRLALSGALVPVLILLTWEGGLFFAPAALAAIAVAARASAAG